MAAFMVGTTYSGTIENSTEIMNGQGWMEEKHRKLLGQKPPRFGTKWREVVYQRDPAVSSYKTDFGSFGDGMACKLPTHPFGLSDAASTTHLFKGSCKVRASPSPLPLSARVAFQQPPMNKQVEHERGAM